MEIKVCGLKFIDNLEAVSKLKANYLGFICFEGSKRNVDIERLKDLTFSIEGFSTPKVMVCVNPGMWFIENYFKICKFDYIQLHGDEEPSVCKEIKDAFDVKVIKAFSVDNKFDLKSCEVYQDACDLFIFDTKCDSFGGSGKVFNWSVLEAYNLNTKYLLSGGINPDNMKKAFEHVSSKEACIGLDVNSGFEIEPGVKDIEKLKILFEKKDSYGF